MCGSHQVSSFLKFLAILKVIKVLNIFNALKVLKVLKHNKLVPKGDHLVYSFFCPQKVKKHDFKNMF